MEACSICGEETGTIILKRKGSTKSQANLFSIPRLLVVPDASCEWCRFLASFLQHLGGLPDNALVGVAKIVTREQDGSEKLLAYVPFHDGENHTKALEDKTEVTFRHRMTLLAESRGDADFALVSVLSKGTSDYHPSLTRKVK